MTPKKQSVELYFEVVIALFGRAGKLSFCSFEILHGDIRKKYIAIFDKILPFSAIKFSNFGRHLPEFPGLNPLPLALVMDMHASKTLCTGLYKS
jgi:hypothetical protein